MADLFKSSLDGTSAEDEGLDSEEYDILHGAGVLSPRHKGGRRKAGGHVVFASSFEEGASLISSFPPLDLFLMPLPHSQGLADCPKRRRR